MTEENVEMERILYLNDEFCAVSEEGRLVEYLKVRTGFAAGQILRGRVERMMPGLEAAFVDIGARKAGFLPLRENSETFTEPPVRSGDTVLVQIRREENGGKGALLSRDLSLPGSHLILMPRNRHAGVSARVTDPEERARLRETAVRISGGKCGIVMREASLHAAEDVLAAEWDDLWRQWENLRNGDLPSGGAGEELLRDYTPRGITRVVYEKEMTADLIRQLKESENRKIRLPHGGNIVVDRCEALTVIDVNSGADAGEGNRRETALRTNLEACREIMIQTRLRNLAGILILDLIDMDWEEDRKRVREALEEAFREDRNKTVIHGYTSLGLMEMTRKRSRATWQETQSP